VYNRKIKETPYMKLSKEDMNQHKKEVKNLLCQNSGHRTRTFSKERLGFNGEDLNYKDIIELGVLLPGTELVTRPFLPEEIYLERQSKNKEYDELIKLKPPKEPILHYMMKSRFNILSSSGKTEVYSISPELLHYIPKDLRVIRISDQIREFYLTN
jgi:hypothetical protein